jgi:hypothetical protein
MFNDWLQQHDFTGSCEERERRTRLVDCGCPSAPPLATSWYAPHFAHALPQLTINLISALFLPLTTSHYLPHIAFPVFQSLRPTFARLLLMPKRTRKLFLSAEMLSVTIRSHDCGDGPMGASIGFVERIDARRAVGIRRMGKCVARDRRMRTDFRV